MSITLLCPGFSFQAKTHIYSPGRKVLVTKSPKPAPLIFERLTSRCSCAFKHPPQIEYTIAALGHRRVLQMLGRNSGLAIGLPAMFSHNPTCHWMMLSFNVSINDKSWTGLGNVSPTSSHRARDESTVNKNTRIYHQEFWWILSVPSKTQLATISKRCSCYFRPPSIQAHSLARLPKQCLVETSEYGLV